MACARARLTTAGSKSRRFATGPHAEQLLIGRDDEERVDAEDVATPEIETEAIDPASLRGGAANPPPATETSGSRLAEAWKD